MLNIDAADLCILLGNILDNAIEACEHVEDNKQIQISVKSQIPLLMKTILLCTQQNRIRIFTE